MIYARSSSFEVLLNIATSHRISNNDNGGEIETSMIWQLFIK